MVGASGLMRGWGRVGGGGVNKTFVVLIPSCFFMFVDLSSGFWCKPRILKNFHPEIYEGEWKVKV